MNRLIGNNFTVNHVVMNASIVELLEWQETILQLGTFSNRVHG
jgi:hypothetical protein